MKMTTDPGRRAVSWLALALVPVALSLAGCSKQKIENPYEPATVTQAVSGESVNKLFKFELSSPEVLAVQGRLALLADGDRLEFLVADDLSLLAGVDPGYKLGVRREWGTNPDIYLVLEHVIDGADTSFVTADEAPVFPSYQNFASYDRSAYVDLGSEIGRMSAADQRSMLRAYGKQGEKIWLSGALAYDEVGGVGSYTLDTSLGRFKLEGVTGFGELFMKSALATGGQIGVGGPMGELYRRSQAEETGIAAPLTLEIFRFQNYLITNA